MALEAVIYPQTQIGNFGFDHILQEDHTFNGFWDVTNNVNYYDQESASNVNLFWDPRSSPEDCSGEGLGSRQVKMEALSSPPAAVPMNTGMAGTAAGRRKRRRTRSGKNKEELESQRMTHITVERNRRKQMNEYLAVIRSLMPASFVQRGDQASIVGGAINFVKELEQQLQTLEVQKRSNFKDFSSPFGDFFTFPQYSIFHQSSGGDGGVNSGGRTTTAKNRPPAMAEIEVTMVESQANVKILSKKRRGQLLKLVAGLKCLWLVVLHLNVTTIEEMVLYTLSVKLEDGCQLSTVDDIADAVNCLLGRIEGELLCSN